MKNMKKLLSFLTAVAVLACCAVPTFAIDQNTPSGSTKVVFKAGETVDDKGTPDPSDDVVSGTYTVSIPDFIEAADTEEEAAVYDVVAKDVLIAFNTNLTVDVTYQNDLKLTDNATATVGYELQANPQSASSLAAVSSGDTILTVPAGNPEQATTTQVAAVLTQAPAYSGVYTNTVTFTVSVA